MLKRGQITIFIILGIVLIAIIGAVLFLRTDIAKTTIKKAVSLTESFTSKTNEVQGIAEDCLKSKLSEATVLYGNKKVENYEQAISDQIKSSLPTCLDFSSVDGVDVSREGTINVVTELSSDKSSLSATATVNIEIDRNTDHQTIEDVYAEYSFTRRCCVPVEVSSDCKAKIAGNFKVCGFLFDITEGQALDQGGECLAC